MADLNPVSGGLGRSQWSLLEEVCARVQAEVQRWRAALQLAEALACTSATGGKQLSRIPAEAVQLAVETVPRYRQCGRHNCLLVGSWGYDVASAHATSVAPVEVASVRRRPGAGQGSKLWTLPVKLFFSRTRVRERDVSNQQAGY